MSTLTQRKSGNSSASTSSSTSPSRLSPDVAKYGTIEEYGWESANASKRAGERFLFYWSFVWVGVMGVIVGTKMFEHFNEWHYLSVGLFFTIPPIFLPMLFPAAEDKNIPLAQRYITKANVWIFIMSWVANYLWTHYFYEVLGAFYTFPSHRFNDVPIACYLMTHSYFHLYHIISNAVLRRLWRHYQQKVTLGSTIVVSIIIAIFAYFMAFAETFTIQNFPYYYIPDRWAMYVYGCVFYSLYFIVSFPLFYRMDEDKHTCWSMERAFIEGCANSMLITQALDFWRLFIGPIVDVQKGYEEAMKNKHANFVYEGRKQKVPFIF